MKNEQKSREKKALYKLYYWNYLVISGLLIGTMFLSLFVMDFIMNRFIEKEIELSHLDISSIYEYPFENMDSLMLDTYGGWYEILDQAGQVIFIMGNKEDQIYHYTAEQLYKKMDSLRNDDAIAYHAFSVEGPNGENYILLWKIPEKLQHVTMAIGIFVVLFSLSLLLAVYIYSRFSVKQVKKPLRHLLEGIKEMERFNYRKRLDFSAEKEFAELQDAFNQMAERLERTSQEKERIEKDKQNMLLHLSHDLKTPITSIYGYSQLLLEGTMVEEDQKDKYLQYIHDKSLYMKNLIKDLFELAKLDDAQHKLNVEAVNIGEWLRQIIVEFYPEIEAKGFELEIDIPEEILLVQIDKIQLKRVMTNIISNSLQYNPAGTLLYISCYSLAEHITILIGDNGIGIDEGMKKYIFDEFTRGTEQYIDSTGLGLAICKKIINLHQGSIELETNYLQRTLFKITLKNADKLIE